MNTLSRRRAVLLPLAAAVAVPSMATTAQVSNGYSFVAEDGTPVLSNARLALWDDGYGDFTAKLTIVPSQEEMNRLMGQGSHVDFVFRFLGLQGSGEGTDFAPGASDHVRQVGAIVDSPGWDPTFRALGFNIEKRWNAGQPIRITAAIYGYMPSNGGVRPRVAVDLVSSSWWFAEGSAVAYERERNGITEQFSAEWGTRYPLVDTYGDPQFQY